LNSYKTSSCAAPPPAPTPPAPAPPADRCRIRFHDGSCFRWY
jgi:hypothetical protein